MPFVTATEAVAHEIHGVRFVSYAAPARGSQELCAWRCEVPAGIAGPPHTVSREEVFLALYGAVELSVDGETRSLAPGDAAVARPGSRVRLANRTQEPAALWVTTSIGLEATMTDGSRISPPWAN
ncbi:cupin domain-containing protein [Actinacidiphila alni]|nr:cupin domain-containing protein [Actinacidiphila alni]